jgi:PPOX class probable FMN-dependent enzyme
MVATFLGPLDPELHHSMPLLSKDQLRRRYPPAAERALRKELTSIDHHMARFISLSPFLVIASANAERKMDASPRGGAPGFVKVADAQTLLIPDAMGNNRLDTLENIIDNPQVGLLFFIPGIDEMLRVNGAATLEISEHLLGLFDDWQNKPRLVIKVDIETAYLHCAKAAMRSTLWANDHRQDRSVLPSMGELIKEHAKLDAPAETQADMLRRYENEL